MTTADSELSRPNRIDRLSRAIKKQRLFIHRVPDPDTRERAEGHLITLVHMRADLVAETVQGIND